MTNEKLQALQQFLNLSNEELKQVTIDGNLFEYYGEEYEILTDSEADDRWEEELNLYIDECIMPELPDWVQNYFDEDAWKRDARFDGRGHSIAHYDGNENEECVDGTYYYIYRQN